jgi:hypothetical protein
MADQIPAVPDWKRLNIFDPLKHSFNPLKDIDYKKARELADVLYTISPQGENTLTVGNGRRALLKRARLSLTVTKLGRAAIHADRKKTVRRSPRRSQNSKGLARRGS